MHDAPDLALLRVFDHLHRERHLTRASRQLGLSQPATSRALARLRELFADPLFVKSPRGMIATPRADALAPAIRDVLWRAADLVRPSDVALEALERELVIGSVDFLEADLLPRLAARVAELAPRVSLTSRPLIAADAGDALAEGRLDLVIGVRPYLPPEAMATHLFDDSFVCVVREGHPVVRRSLSLDRFCALSHVLIAPRNEPGSPVDDVLATLGRTRHVAVRTHTFLSAPLVVAATDHVLTGPARVLVPTATQVGLRLFTPPIELRSFAVWAAWHPRVQHDPVHAWLRGLVREVAPGPVPRARRATRSARRAR
ncbi:MAG: LysR family transcriptional regulator [Sandaracinaceae bacterium]|nr:LysR family transcriptional regulator [Sandaracinaceae bacterium]